jgi:hypothetical protein
VSTPEKPRPSLDDTLHRIDEAIDALAAEMAAQPQCHRCARQAVIGSELCAYHLQLGPREMIEELGPVTRDGKKAELTPGHRRSCQHDGPPGPTCPGCTEIDELLAIAHTNAAPFPSPAERALRTVAEASAELLGRERPPIQPPAVVDPDRGWLARLRRLFGDGGP